MANEKLIPLSEIKKKLTAVRQYFSGYPSTDQDKLAQAVAKMCIEEIGKLKPVDAVPVVHGQWEQVQRWATKAKYRCSVCGREIMSAVEVNIEKYPYCHCGAKMDGERRADG